MHISIAKAIFPNSYLNDGLPSMDINKYDDFTLPISYQTTLKKNIVNLF
jgi:hypothetical protein